MIKRCRKEDIDSSKPESEQKWCLYTKDGSKLLGRHQTKDKAKDQETAIQISKHSYFIYKAIIGLLR